MQNQVETTKFTPEKSKQIALARLDLVHQWLEFRKKSKNKLQADYDFVKLHNTSNSYLYKILGKISRGSLHRWNSMLDRSEDYEKLLPQYKYATVQEYRTVLTDEEIKIFMGLLLHPNRLCIGKAIALTKYKLQQQNQSFIPADITFRRYAKWLDNAKVEVYKQTSETEKKKLLKKYNDEFDKKKADLAKDYAKKLAEIDKNISNAIAIKAKEKGYDLVFAKASILYGADDLTEEVIKIVK